VAGTTLLSNRVHERIRSAFLADPRHVAGRQRLNESWLPLTEADSGNISRLCSMRSNCGAAALRPTSARDLGIGAEALSMLGKHCSSDSWQPGVLAAYRRRISRTLHGPIVRYRSSLGEIVMGRVSGKVVVRHSAGTASAAPV